MNREELQSLRDNAENEATIDGLNQTCARAYLNLADAADHLDAMIARTEEKED